MRIIMPSINLSVHTQHTLNLGKQAEARANNASANLASGNKSVVAVNVSDELTATSTRSSLKAASTGASNVVAFLGTAQGYLAQVSSVLDAMKNITTTGNSGVASAAWRTNAATQFTSLIAQLDSINTNATFKGQDIFSGNAMIAQVGADSGETYTTSAMAQVDATTLRIVVGGGADLTNQTNSAALGTLVDAAIAAIGAQAANIAIDIDALNQRLAVNTAYDESLGAQISDLTEADPATEMADYTKNNVLQQAAQAMLAKDSQTQQNILFLMR